MIIQSIGLPVNRSGQQIKLYKINDWFGKTDLSPASKRMVLDLFPQSYSFYDLTIISIKNFNIIDRIALSS